jgi:hypothetical protein
VALFAQGANGIAARKTRTVVPWGPPRAARPTPVTQVELIRTRKLLGAIGPRAPSLVHLRLRAGMRNGTSMNSRANLVSGCFVSIMSRHLVPNREEIGVETEALAQRVHVQLEVPSQIVDDPTGFAAQMVLHVVAKIL